MNNPYTIMTFTRNNEITTSLDQVHKKPAKLLKQPHTQKTNNCYKKQLPYSVMTKVLHIISHLNPSSM